jgi:hypothetical protein
MHYSLIIIEAIHNKHVYDTLVHLLLVSTEHHLRENRYTGDVGITGI